MNQLFAGVPARVLARFDFRKGVDSNDYMGLRSLLIGRVAPPFNFR